MPYSKKKYSFGLAFIVSLIVLALLNSHSHNNPSPSLENQEEIVNNDYQEENIEEFNHHLSLLDNVIINTIIFLLLFIIALYFVYFASFSPVARNNSEETIEDPTKKTLNKNILRKQVILKGRKFFKKTKSYHLIIDESKKDENSEKLPEMAQVECVWNDNKKEFEFKDFDLSKCSSFLRNTYYIKEEEERFKEEEEFVPEQIEEIKEINKAFEEQKSLFFNNGFVSSPIVIRIPNFNEKVEKNKFYYDIKKNIVNFDFYKNGPDQVEKISLSFEGKLSFFNSGNIFAFLLSSGFFLVSFGFLYFVLYFLYALIDAFIEAIEEENKWLFALYKAWDAIILSNFRGLSKIIPLGAFLIKILFIGYIFFGSSLIFTPIVYHVDTSKKAKKLMNPNNKDGDLNNADPNIKETKRPIKIHKYLGFGTFLKTGEIDIAIDDDYESTEFKEEEEKKEVNDTGKKK